MKHSHLQQLALGCLALLMQVPFGQAEETAVKPNVLFIAVDDLNDWIGVLGGHPQARTPNMDRLAKRGLLFTKAFCSAPGCNASRSSLLTGQRPSTTGIYGNAHDWRKAPRLKDAVTLPRHFKNNGYLTYGTGKLFHAHTFFDKKNHRQRHYVDGTERYSPGQPASRTRRTGIAALLRRAHNGPSRQVARHLKAARRAKLDIRPRLAP